MDWQPISREGLEDLMAKQLAEATARELTEVPEGLSNALGCARIGCATR